MKLGDDHGGGFSAHPRAAAPGDARVDAVLTQVFAPAPPRLSEAERAAIFGLLGRLVEEIETDLRRLLPIGAGRRATMPAGDTLARLNGAAFFNDRDLASALLDRIDEAALSARLAGARQRVPAAEGQSAALRAAYAERAARRWDASGAPVLPAADLPEDVLRRTIVRVAAAVCAGIAVAPDDPEVERASTRIFIGHVAAGPARAAAEALARAAFSAPRMVVARALGSGDLLLASAAGALWLGIPLNTVLRAIIRPDARDLPVVLRALDVDRDTAARVIFAAGTSPSAAYTAEAAMRTAAIFAVFEDLGTEEARRRLHAPSDGENYRTARAAFDANRRERVALG